MNIVSNNNRLLSINGGVGPGGGDMWVSGLDYSGNVITGYSGTAFGGVCECDSAAVVNSAFGKSTAWVTEQGYINDTATLPFVQNTSIGFEEGLISGISGTGFYAVSAASANEAVSALSAGESVSALSSISAEYAVKAGSAEFAGSATSALVSEQSNYSERAGSAYTATYDISGNSIYDNYVRNSELDDLPYVQNTALGIDNNRVTSISGYGVGDFDNLDYVQNTALGISGDKITAISSYEIKGCDCPPHVAVTGSGSVTISKPADTVIISGKQYDSDITAASSYAFEQATAAIPTGLMYKTAIGSANNMITSYDNVPFAGQDGHEYTGISPINVNNTTDLISLDNPLQIRGIDPVYITEDANNLYIGCSASNVPMKYTNHNGQTGNVSALNFNSNLDGSLAMTIGGCERNAYLIPQSVTGTGYLWCSGGGKFGIKTPDIVCTAFSYPDQTINLTNISGANAILVWCPNDLDAGTYTVSGRTGYSIMAQGLWTLWVDDHSSYGCILSGNGFYEEI